MKYVTTLPTRSERLAAHKTMTAAREALSACYHDHREGTPAETVAALVSELGYDLARDTIAECINTVSLRDDRIGRDVREWAETMPTAADRCELTAIGFFQPSDIHPAHLHQIAKAMMEYNPAPAHASDDVVPYDDRADAHRLTLPERVNLVNRMGTRVLQTRSRSAWVSGVHQYALAIIDTLSARMEYEGRAPTDREELKLWCLNGAQDWKQASYGGCYGIYDKDIAATICTPSELKRNHNGALPPNKRESWLDVQARALNAAFWLVDAAYLSCWDTVNQCLAPF